MSSRWMIFFVRNRRCRQRSFWFSPGFAGDRRWMPKPKINWNEMQWNINKNYAVSPKKRVGMFSSTEFLFYYYWIWIMFMFVSLIGEHSFHASWIVWTFVVWFHRGAVIEFSTATSALDRWNFIAFNTLVTAQVHSMCVWFIRTNVACETLYKAFGSLPGD